MPSNIRTYRQQKCNQVYFLYIFSVENTFPENAKTDAILKKKKYKIVLLGNYDLIDCVSDLITAGTVTSVQTVNTDCISTCSLFCYI